MKVADKSNEITAIPALLELLDLAGCIITINALNLEQSLKCSNRQKSNRAAMDNNYMLTILAACLSHHKNQTSEASCQ